MKRKFIVLSFSLFLTLTFGSVERLLACSCVPTAPCQSFGRSDISFVGKVVGSKYQRTVDDYQTINEGTEKETTVTKKLTYDVGEIYFEVLEAFNGVEKDSRVTINSSTSGEDCGAWFKRGGTYVVFASKENSTAATGISRLTYGGSVEKLKPDTNRLWTNMCSGTNEIEDAEGTLSYLRNLPEAGSGGTLVGRIDETIRNYTSGKFNFQTDG